MLGLASKVPEGFHQTIMRAMQVYVARLVWGSVRAARVVGFCAERQRRLVKLSCFGFDAQGLLLCKSIATLCQEAQSSKFIENLPVLRCTGLVGM